MPAGVRDLIVRCFLSPVSFRFRLPVGVVGAAPTTVIIIVGVDGPDGVLLHAG